MTPPPSLLLFHFRFRFRACTAALCTSSGPPGSGRGMGCDPELWARAVGPDLDTGWHPCSDRSMIRAVGWWSRAEVANDPGWAWSLTTDTLWPAFPIGPEHLHGREWLTVPAESGKEQHK